MAGGISHPTALLLATELAIYSLERVCSFGIIITSQHAVQLAGRQIKSQRYPRVPLKHPEKTTSANLLFLEANKNK